MDSGKDSFGLKDHLLCGSAFWLISSTYITILTIVNFHLRNIYFVGLNASDRFWAVKIAVWYNFSFFFIFTVVLTLAASLLLSRVSFLKRKSYWVYLSLFLLICVVLQSSQLLRFKVLGKPGNPKFIAMIIILTGIVYLFLFLLSKVILRVLAPLGPVSVVLFVLASVAFLITGAAAGVEAVDHKYNRPNILLISIDTLRGDHCSFNGYFRKTTPNLDRLARESVVFSNARCCNPLTLPSLSSIMTGTYPQKHGLRDNLNYRLGDENLTLAEILKKEGYSTGAVVANRVAHSSRKLNQGFEYYGESFAFDYLSHLIPGLISYKILVEAFGLENLWHWRSGAGYCTDLALRWLEEHCREKFFLWVHYMEPHLPYDPPKVFADTFQAAAKTRLKGKFTKDTLYRIYNRLPPRQEEISAVHQLYDGEILYADHEIDRLLQTVEELGLFANTVFIFTSDHGEGLVDEHYWYGGHGHFIFSQDIKVPLFIRFPKQSRKGTVNAPLSNIAIFATVLDILGTLDEYGKGTDAASLLPFIQSTKEENPPAIFAESGDRLAFDPRRIEAIKEGGENPYRVIPRKKQTLTKKIGLELLNEKKLRAIIDGDWKLIYTPAHQEAEHFELYNLREDPDERIDLSRQSPREFSRLKELLLSWVSSDTLPAPSEAFKLSEREMEALKALGYFR